MTAGPVERQVSASEGLLRSAGVGAGSGRPVGGVWLRRASALVVAAVAAYASYQHQRRFALAGGADPLGAALWPASVAGLMVLATVNLLTANVNSRRAWWAARWSFALGAVVSLAANIAAAPRLAWQPILVAGWPPLALVLAVELLAYRPDRPATETSEGVRAAETTEGTPVTPVGETGARPGRTRLRRNDSWPGRRPPPRPRQAVGGGSDVGA
jgi:lysylphosphatidylglycerol synthetase-like protein (DUF2156 family)